MTLGRKGAVGLAASLFLALCALPAFAQQWPVKPVRMLVGFPPGGGTDVLARLVAEQLSQLWGQQVVVENRPGASATIASGVVAKTAPDGYTLSMGVGTSPNMLVVTPGLPAHTVPELVALLKKEPHKHAYASSGPGSLQHIAAAQFSSMAGVDIVHVPYKGSGQAIVDLVSGHVQLNFDSIPAVAQQVKSGKLRAIAVTAAKRAQGFPDVPAIAEYPGFASYDLTTWWGLFAPAGVPEALIAKINHDVDAALQDANVRARFADLSVEPGGGTRQQFAAYLAGEMEKYGRLVKALDIKGE
ncbi:MAG TPA: tripartite tricarboxylate transporter substrate binding protein [Usitatibacter sp.]|nr:tripartite tricarboxylate transporter substrate binding protein [Usitatibacter sp.]